MELDEAVDRLGPALVRAAGVELAEELGPPGPQGPAEARDFGDRAARERGEGLLGERATAA